MSKVVQTAKRLYQAGNKFSLSVLFERKSTPNLYSRRHFATETEQQSHEHGRRLTWRDFREGRCNLDELANDNRHIGVYIVLSFYVVVGVTLKKVFGGKKKGENEEVISVEQAEAAPTP
ncbi:hypothetical protein Gasu2_19220 [Galdieria sulphuraria]|uniref:Uncharacterized protein n=1 Tax=Galdieria sulphuraria TaxID=130081 RepID=M2WTH8_GALSU|nr:uncharacterized protein Gasu_51860 [Galdieria sulphuraria]EME27205.1 hypothetical protein Gasu_51860 [Galdieria sulphuraria]GJD07570.1 hypothetical protein Gasu2_19220 [Galdieria sulphuraria]|eukprot:XP_005703725.1 hypothetical protein Gasu_51860 [Galdieria sulphuraria]